MGIFYACPSFKINLVNALQKWLKEFLDWPIKWLVVAALWSTATISIVSCSSIRGPITWLSLWCQEQNPARKPARYCISSPLQSTGFDHGSVCHPVMCLPGSCCTSPFIIKLTLFTGGTQLGWVSYRLSCHLRNTKVYAVTINKREKNRHLQAPEDWIQGCNCWGG